MFNQVHIPDFDCDIEFSVVSRFLWKKQEIWVTRISTFEILGMNHVLVYP
jgi:hypothetical protein